jgi:DUF4097 and DUF4098 domain-containing protein YvlB
MQRHFVTLIFVLGLLPAVNAAAQDEDRAQRWLQNCESNSIYDRARFCELRSYTIAPTSRLVVDGRDNGGVSFIGWDRNEVRIVAMVEANADRDSEAQALAKEVKVSTNGGRVRADGPPSRGKRSWSVSYHVYVPRQSNLEAITTNGGVSAQLVEGTMEFTTTNGGISLDQVGGDIRAETTNGGVSARLAGSTWKGRGLDLRTTNGGVSVTIPRGYNARLETGTTNGGMNIDFPITVQGLIGKHIETQLGSGGPLVRVVTTNGGVKISQR